MGLRIEIGKRYIQRNGDRTARVLTVDGMLANYPVVVEGRNGYVRQYTKDGHYCVNGISDYDLVEEYTEARDWKLDDMLVVVAPSDMEYLRRFAGILDGHLRCFASGEDSTNYSSTYIYPSSARLATEEDFARLTPPVPKWFAPRRKVDYSNLA